jgi:thiamine pyrophosphokinase|tara:strand:+ start:3452 stop:3736 length:285 start_codon:yes stop_codon:yes gene_type:complete
MGVIKSRPTIENTAMTTANTEYSYKLQAGTRKFTIKLRDVGYPLKLAMVESGSGTTYVNIVQGQTYTVDDIKVPLTLYFQSTTGSMVAEIISWI